MLFHVLIKSVEMILDAATFFCVLYWSKSHTSLLRYDDMNKLAVRKKSPSITFQSLFYCTWDMKPLLPYLQCCSSLWDWLQLQIIYFFGLFNKEWGASIKWIYLSKVQFFYFKSYQLFKDNYRHAVNQWGGC